MTKCSELQIHPFHFEFEFMRSPNCSCSSFVEPKKQNSALHLEPLMRSSGLVASRFIRLAHLLSPVEIWKAERLGLWRWQVQDWCTSATAVGEEKSCSSMYMGPIYIYILYSGNFILKKFRPWYLASEIFRNVYSILKSSIEKNTCPIEILHDFTAKIVW